MGIVCEFVPSHPTPFIEGDYSISHSCGNTIRCVPPFFMIIVLFLHSSITLLSFSEVLEWSSFSQVFKIGKRSFISVDS